MKISAVVFDIGNVLIGWTPAQFFDAKIGADRRRAFFDAVPILAAMLRLIVARAFLIRLCNWWINTLIGRLKSRCGILVGWIWSAL